jgi:hypothetical protein
MREVADRKKRVLFVIKLDGHFRELFRVATMLHDSGRYEPAFYFTHYATMETDQATCDACGFAWTETPRPVDRVRNSGLGLVQCIREAWMRLRQARLARLSAACWSAVRGHMRRAARPLRAAWRETTRCSAGGRKAVCTCCRALGNAIAWPFHAVRYIFRMELRLARFVWNMQCTVMRVVLAEHFTPLGRGLSCVTKPFHAPMQSAWRLASRNPAVAILVWIGKAVVKSLALVVWITGRAGAALIASWRGALHVASRAVQLLTRPAAWMRSKPARLTNQRQTIPRKAWAVVLALRAWVLARGQGLMQRLRGGTLFVPFERCLRTTRDAARVLEQCAPHVVVLAEDNVGYATGAFTKLAHSHQIPVLVFPYTIANAREFAEAYFDVPANQISAWPNGLVARLYPQWRLTHKGRTLVRLPAGDILAQEWLGLAPPAPWALNSGFADAIAVESQHIVNFYRAAGLRTEPLLATGAIVEDDMAVALREADSRRESLYRRLGLPARRRLLVSALPPNQMTTRPHPVFKSYEEMLAAWLAPLSRVKNYNLVVRPHPRIDRRMFPFIERLGGVISEDDTASLVPLCDIYVASVSATIRWAVACGIPVVNYDVFRYQYDDYADAAGVLTIEEHQDYVQTVERLTTDPDFYTAVRNRQQDCSKQWGFMDGRSSERILGLFDRMTGQLGNQDDANSDLRAWQNGKASRANRLCVGA